jgi:hypothetical protein
MPKPRHELIIGSRPNDETEEAEEEALEAGTVPTPEP